MDDKLQLTARGHAVCDLMLRQGLSLEAACERVELQLETLRQNVDQILNDRPWEDVPTAMQAALEGVSAYVQNIYLEEQRRPTLAAGASLSV